MKDELEVTLKKAKEEPVTMDDVVMRGTPFGVLEMRSGISPVIERPRMILNPNKDVALKILERIYKCHGYCPCQPSDPNIDTRCPCPDFVDKGICHCKLFVQAE